MLEKPPARTLSNIGNKEVSEFNKFLNTDSKKVKSIVRSAINKSLKHKQKNPKEELITITNQLELDYDKFDHLIINYPEAIKMFRHKLSFISLYKLNWNIPDNVLDKLETIIVHEYSLVIIDFIKNFENYVVSPVVFLFFIRFIFPDLFAIIILKTINQKPINKRFLRDGVIDFHDLSLWAKVSNPYENKTFNLDNCYKALLDESTISNPGFIYHLTFESKVIEKLIIHGHYFNEYLREIEFVYDKEEIESKFKKSQISNNDKVLNNIKEDIKCNKELLESLSKIIASEKEKESIMKQEMNPFIKSHIKDVEFSVSDITMTILSEEKVDLRINKMKLLTLTYDQFGFSDVENGKTVPSKPWDTLLKFCKYNITPKDDHIRTDISRLNEKLQKEFGLKEKFIDKEEQKGKPKIYITEFTLNDRFYNTKKKTI